MAIWSWCVGSKISFDPAVVGEGLAALMEECGGALSPAGVVDRAAYPGSPFHGLFVGGAAVAARGYRLAQAGRIIRSIRIQRTEGEEPKRYHINVVTAVGKVYMPIVHVREDAALWAQIMTEEVSRLKAAERRLRDIEEAGVREINQRAGRVVRHLEKAIAAVM